MEFQNVNVKFFFSFLFNYCELYDLILDILKCFWTCIFGFVHVLYIINNVYSIYLYVCLYYVYARTGLLYVHYADVLHTLLPTQFIQF